MELLFYFLILYITFGKALRVSDNHLLLYYPCKFVQLFIVIRSNHLTTSNFIHLFIRIFYT